MRQICRMWLADLSTMKKQRTLVYRRHNPPAETDEPDEIETDDADDEFIEAVPSIAESVRMFVPIAEKAVETQNTAVTQQPELMRIQSTHQLEIAKLKAHDVERRENHQQEIKLKELDKAMVKDNREFYLVIGILAASMLIGIVLMFTGDKQTALLFFTHAVVLAGGWLSGVGYQRFKGLKDEKE